MDRFRTDLRGDRSMKVATTVQVTVRDIVVWWSFNESGNRSTGHCSGYCCVVVVQ